MTREFSCLGGVTSIVALACLVFVLLVPVAQAAEPVSVKGGETVIVATPAKDFTVTVEPKFGRWEKVKPAAAGATYQLKYSADNTTEVRTDTLTYRIEGDATDHVVSLDIAPSAQVGFSGMVYEQSFRAIFLLFVLAVILESALAVIFNWRPFVENLNPRAVRPPIAFIVALIFVRFFDLDIATSLVNAVNNARYSSSLAGQILTALVIAGGSSGVNNMLVALGFRAVRTPETVTPKPPPDKAWLAVRAKPGQAVGDLLVFLGPPGSLTLLGAIKGRSKPSLLAWCLSDRGRLPNYGGHTVQPDQDYVVEVQGSDAQGNAVGPVRFGPLKFARGAIVDLDVTL